MHCSFQCSSKSYCYQKIIWKLLLDKKIKRTDLIKTANLSITTLAKSGKDQPVSMEAMSRICKALQYDIGDVMEMLPDSEETK